MSEHIVRLSNWRESVGIDCSQGGRTKQSDQAGCDINVLMDQYRTTGQINWQNNATPQYGDYTNVGDYQAAQNLVAEANSLFAELPAPLRKRMDNDPTKLAAYLADTRNHEEAVELGLLEFTESPPPLPEPEVETPPASEGGESTPD